MSKNDYIIRLERKDEYREVETLVRDSNHDHGSYLHHVGTETSGTDFLE